MIPFNEARIAKLRSELEDHIRNHKTCTRSDCEYATQEGAEAVIQRAIKGIEEAEAKAEADGTLGNWKPPETS
jgi:hypothetical protein